MVCIALRHHRFLFTSQRGPFSVHLLEHILTTVLLPVRQRQSQRHSIIRVGSFFLLYATQGLSKLFYSVCISQCHRITFASLQW